MRSGRPTSAAAVVGGLILTVCLASACTPGGHRDIESPTLDSRTSPTRGTDAVDCGRLTTDDQPVMAVRRAPSPGLAKALASSGLPRTMPAPAEILRLATPLLEDLPGRVRMIVFWGEPDGVLDTESQVTLLGVDGRWRSLSLRDLGEDRPRFLKPGPGSLAPDGSRWVVVTNSGNHLLDLGTGGLTRIAGPRRRMFTSWAPDSSAVALHDLRQADVLVVDRAGALRATVPLAPGRRVVHLPDGEHVTLVDAASPRTAGRLRLATYDLDGDLTSEIRCAVPSGSVLASIGVTGFDGERINLVGRVAGDAARRYSVVEAATGAVISDVVVNAPTYVEQWVGQGFYVSPITGASRTLDIVEPSTGTITTVSHIDPYVGLSGHDNLPASVYAADLVMGPD